ncbi:MAG: SWIM zinc finger family protein, partial [Alphaproteobacteria bacterium]|nr:SWIM zinc finger family protein [Alphaproteobacteria bacterium]
DSFIELLQGKLSTGVMEIISHQERGLFPHPKDIELSCSCYDYADMCKHVAAVLYGIGVRLDERPEDLFLLRKANHVELIEQAGSNTLIEEQPTQDIKTFTGDLSSLFGIDIEGAESSTSSETSQVQKTKVKKKEKKTKISASSRLSNKRKKVVKVSQN